MHPWSAEHVVDELVARRLLVRLPSLDARSLRLLGAGWDNSVWLVDERWVFRFPRREVAVPAVRLQLEALPLLAPLLPLPIPTPVYAGEPTAEFPWPFFGASYLPGRELAEAGLDDDSRARLAIPLAGFLRVLHADGTRAAVAAVELPIDPTRRGDAPARAGWTTERLAELRRLGMWRAHSSVSRVLTQAALLPPPHRLALVHGDLHLRHALVDDGGALAAVIDWDDICLADPAVDLSLLWSLLPRGARSDFLEAYGETDEAQLLRARVLALFFCAALALYARHEGLGALEREAVAGLERAAAD